jgi:hypothetical protein
MKKRQSFSTKFILPLIFGLSLAHADDQCFGVYKTSSDNIISRFMKYYNSHPTDFFGMTLSKFFDLELKGLTDRHTQQMDKLQLKGTSAHLTSELSTLNIHLSTLDKKLTDITMLLHPSKARLLLTREASRNQTMETKIEDFQSCRAKMEICVGNLESAIELANTTIQELQVIINDLKIRRTELSELESYINRNLNVMNPTAAGSMVIFNRKIEMLNANIVTSEATLDAHSRNLTVATLTLMDLPEFYQKVKEAIAAGAPDKLLEKPKVLTANTTSLPTSNATYEQIISVLHSSIDKRSKLTAVKNIVLSTNETFTGKQSYEILRLIPKKQNWGENSPHENGFMTNIKRRSRVDWEGFIRMELIIAYDLAKKTQPSLENQPVIAEISKIFKREARWKDDRYANAITALIGDLSIELIGR